MESDLWIWVNKWDDYQSFQKKRGKPWAPPWIKIYPQLLDDWDFVRLPWQTQLVLLKLFMAFAQTRGSLSADTRELSRQLAQKVTTPQLDSLNHAGWIDVCSRTVLEQRRNVFWNSSVLEVDVEVDVEKKRPSAVSDTPNAARTKANTERPQQDLEKEQHIPKEAVDDLVTATTNGLGQGFAQKVSTAADDDIPF